MKTHDVKTVEEFEVWLDNNMTGPQEDYAHVSRRYLPFLTPEERMDMKMLLVPGVIPSILDRNPKPSRHSASTRMTYNSKFRSSLYGFFGLRQIQPRQRRRPTTYVQHTELSVQDQLSEAYASLARWPYLRSYLVPRILEAEQKLVRP